MPSITGARADAAARPHAIHPDRRDGHTVLPALRTEPGRLLPSGGNVAPFGLVSLLETNFSTSLRVLWAARRARLPRRPAAPQPAAD
jgi:hypothetical protein